MDHNLFLAGLSSFTVQGLRIAIAVMWTVAALIATLFHYINLGEAKRNQHAVRNSGPLGVEVARMLVRIEWGRFLWMSILSGVGIMALAGPPYQQLAGWGLLFLPFIGVWASLADRRSRARQKTIVEAGIAKQLIAKKLTVESSGDEVIARPDPEIPPPPSAA